MLVLLTLNREMCLVSSDYDAISIMQNKLLHRFFSNNKVLLSSTHTSYIFLKKISLGMFKKNQSFITFRVCYRRNNLAHLKGYPVHRDVADMSNLFYFHFVFI